MVSVSEVDWKIEPRRCKLMLQRAGVRDVAVMRHGKAAGGELGEERLHVAQVRAAGGGIAVVADGAVALQPLHHRRLGEVVADQADMALVEELLAVEADDAGRLLAAMLKRVQAERGQRGRVGMAEYAEDAAFLVEGVVERMHHGVGHRHGLAYAQSSGGGVSSCRSSSF